ncbi:protein HGH1 homolog isoform X2 [Selaginella moellendorffii]|uniref:protein HGH1 homolog isoform X2 n=2 Tax=Selaginella moellendorffii TaxID=88036 RepID=UPI000D1C44C6|nr:protein HGH1 homolog isoform X2 [Selaginella moellendorffii]|eukprot:XP_024519146.1 protein HGH1 homolog isoform X2 [Selaginella moellendorffii]
MAEELDELLMFLSSPAPNLRKAAVDIIEGLTGSDEGIAKLSTKLSILLPALVQLLAGNKLVAKPAAGALVNLSQDQEVGEMLLELGAVAGAMDQIGKQGQDVDKLMVMLLVNLTTLEPGARLLCEEGDEKLKGLHMSRLVRLFSRTPEEGDDAYEHVGAILVNVSRTDLGRKLMLDTKRGLLKQVLRQCDSKSLVRRRGVIGTIRNCCFEAPSHLPSLLSLSELLWPCLILPAAGSKIYSEEERSKMPPELAVPLSIERQAEPDSQIRREALDALYLLIKQEAGFRAFWELGGADVLKSGYENEEDPEVMDKYEQLGSLVRTDTHALLFFSLHARTYQTQTHSSTRARHRSSRRVAAALDRSDGRSIRFDKLLARNWRKVCVKHTHTGKVLEYSLLLHTPTSQRRFLRASLFSYKEKKTKAKGFYFVCVCVCVCVSGERERDLSGGRGVGERNLARMSKIMAYSELAEHNNRKDCWLLISGKIYDVTKFLEDHPGGDEVILSATGKDATDDFEDVGHSSSARDMMHSYYIGEVDSATLPAKPTFKLATQDAYNPDKTSQFLIKILQFLVPLAILGLAVAVRFFTKQS